MYKLRKIFCLLLAALMLLAVSACGTTAKDEVSEVKGIATSFLDSVCKLDLKEAASYLDGEVDLPFDNAESLISSLMDKTLGGNEELASFKDSLMPVLTLMINAIKNSMKYEVKDCTVDGENATVKVDFSMLDTDAVNLDDLDIENTDFDFEGYIQELFDNGQISEETSEEDIIAAVMPKLVEVMSGEVQKELDSAETTTEEKEITLTKKDGKWVITDGADFLEGLDEITPAA